MTTRAYLNAAEELLDAADDTIDDKRSSITQEHRAYEAFDLLRQSMRQLLRAVRKLNISDEE